MRCVCNMSRHIIARTNCRMDVGTALSPEKRAQILSGAAAVFAADGYEGASMARIAAVAGVSKGTLYNYFDSKAALFTATINEICERHLARGFDQAAQAADPAEVRRSVGKGRVQMILPDRGLAISRMVIPEAA